ncbi:MarR family winged helix-turn-helix transcriptional regulator [Rhizorhapis suberifaciens]|uniref:DNA-binding MarR family transcriptional regulator n=1 Tax=Rhizorhapis suberifaciens TaxID=13656 RepID=A0A840HRS1_9SPHN|nr:MarR family winged helix-turn-helix transcriptional regulator [Rhizorhapis suberifaciens]MBB4640593.1 DNA-binding MarR family transcriptional regulator [Rhizorhapis suberifaciens]
MTDRDDILSPENLGSDVELLIALLKLSSMISRPMRDGVAIKHGLSTNELRVLMCVGGEGPVAGHDISETMAIPPMNVSRALAELDERSWLRREDNDENRRRRPVSLNDQGWDALGSMIPDIRQIAQHFFSTIRRGDQAKLLELIAKINGQIESWSEPAESGAPKKKMSARD